MWARVHTISSATPSATQGWNNAPMSASGELPISPSCCMPRVRNEFPATLLRIVRTANNRVLPVRLLVAGIGGNGRLLPLVRNKLLAARPQSHIFARFLGQPLAVVRVEDHFPHHAPDYPRAEIVFAVETLHPIHQLGFVQV